MIEYDDIAGHVAIILRTTKKWKLKNLVSGSIAQKDAVIEEISQNVSRSVRGTFELRRKDWREGLRASDWRRGDDSAA
jgi:hypothetical protein